MFRHILIFFVASILFYSCERIGNSPVSGIGFSTDTVFFDTVFTSVGTATKELRVKNTGKTSLVINHISLAGGQSSKFRLNIDGEPVNEKDNIPIDAGDSIFIFIDAFINPLSSDSPVTVTDSIIFNFNDNLRSVKLLAWGQDINLIKDGIIKNAVWVKGKPYVIYNQATVDSLGTLTIDEGVKVLFHRNSVMTIYGTLIVNGQFSQPVLFASDRTEMMYEDIPGQWTGIEFKNSSKGNIINNAIIRNSVYGLRADDLNSNNGFPDIKINSSVIAHSSVSGISASNSNILAANCIIYHCGINCISISGGGVYNFVFCTLFNRWDYGFRLTPVFLVSEKPSEKITLTLVNTVLYGDNISELNMIPSGSTLTGNYIFDHCLVKLDTLHSAFWKTDLFPYTSANKNPLFIDLEKWDLRPDTLSPLINRGNQSYSAAYPFDVRGVSRSSNGIPDIGAYERLPGEHKKVK